jgi:hypothetical protein
LADHELCRAFESIGLALHPVLVEMLDEHHRHRTERRGCGYTQATRHLADLTNRRGLANHAADILKNLFAAAVPEWPAREWLDRREQLRAQLQFPESELLVAWIWQLAGPIVTADGGLPVAPEGLKVGSCPLAEQYFLELAHGRLRRRGFVHVWTGADQAPWLIEKHGLGDNRSAVSVRELRLGGVDLPPGVLFALDYLDDDLASAPAAAVLPGRVVDTRHLKGVRVLRVTTLAVDPEDRRRAFTVHFQQQLDNALYSPDVTTIGQLRGLADQMAGYLP